MVASVQSITQQINIIYNRYMRDVQSETESIDTEIEQLSQRRQFLLSRRSELSQLREKVLQLSQQMDDVESQYRTNREKHKQLSSEIKELEELLAAKRRQVEELSQDIDQSNEVRRQKYQEISALINHFSEELGTKPVSRNIAVPEASETSASGMFAGNPSSGDLDDPDILSAIVAELPETLDQDSDPLTVSSEDLSDEMLLDLGDEMKEEFLDDQEAAQTVPEDSEIHMAEDLSLPEPQDQSSNEDDDVELSDLQTRLSEEELEDMDSDDITEEMSLVEELSSILDGAPIEKAKQSLADSDLDDSLEDLDLDLDDLDDDVEMEELEGDTGDLDQDALDEILNALGEKDK